MRRSVHVLGSAVALSFLSRILGFFRESTIVGIVGVHDYTDAYFAVSVLVVWLQNWAFGAFALYFVPKYLSLEGEARARWSRFVLRALVIAAAVCAIAFAVAYPVVEGFLLGGRRVLQGGPVLLLGACLPVTVGAGVLNSRLIATADGVVASARALLIANLLGLASLYAAAFLLPGAAILPATLAATQVATAASLSWELRRAKELDAGRAVGRGTSRSQIVATTCENIGFNLNAVAHQAVAGRLPPGVLTLNAFAMRLVLYPLSGILQPIQQRLLVHFSSGEGRTPERTLATTILLSLGGALVIALSLAIAAVCLLPLIEAHWPFAASARDLSAVVGLYAVDAGIVFSLQASARYAFSLNRGWTYTAVMLAAYAVGSGAKAALAMHVGVVGLPLGAVLAEGGALAVVAVVLLRRRPRLDVRESVSSAQA